MSLLTLVSVSRTERYRPLVEDVIDAIAVLDESPEFDRTALNRFVGLAIPLVALAITVMTLVAWSRTGHGWWWSLALGVFGSALLVGSVLSKNRYDNLDMAESLLVAAAAGAGGRGGAGRAVAKGCRLIGCAADCGRGARWCFC